MSTTSPLTRAEAIARLTAKGQPHELLQQSIRSLPCRTFVNAPPSLAEFFQMNRSDATFYVYEHERYTFEEMYLRAGQVAASLTRDYGIKKGDRVAISMRNYPEWVMAFTAITSIGAIAVAMNALWEAEELEYGLKHCGVKVIFADQERLDRLSRCSPDLEVAVIAVRPRDPSAVPGKRFEEILATPGEMPSVDIHPDDDATILFTSGSTGHPKGAVSSHRNILSALFSWELEGAAGALVNQLTPVEREYQLAALLGVPLFHVAGSHAVLLSSYRSQRKVVAMYKWDTVRACELIEQEKIASFVAPAAMTGDLIEVALKTDRDLSSLAMVGGGGAPRAPEQVKRIASTFKKAMPNTGWGMTETNAIGTGISGQDYLNRPGSSGRCAPVLDIRIVDEAGTTLAANQRGELLITGTSMIRGYWNNDEANATAFTGEGWFRTGDVAYVDDEGFLFIVDRIKQLIIRGGENIGCGEVEAGLLAHPHIKEASAYSIPDDRLGEEVGATIYVTQAIDEDELRAFLHDHLARFKIPRYIAAVQEPLPRIASGKINKMALRASHIAAVAAKP